MLGYNLAFLILRLVLFCIFTSLTTGFNLASQQVLLNAQSKSANRGAVASENTECSRIGADLLEQGGNAADAMIGTVFCIGVMNMYHSGIGGGGFALVRAPNGSFEVIDFRESAPATASKNMFKNNSKGSVLGGLASGTPGELRGLEYLHQRYGSLDWQKIMEPAINLSRHGFQVTHDLARYMALDATGANFLENEPTWALDFAPNGTLVGVGDVMTRRRYADTLELISQGGADAFYSGPVANATISGLQKLGGIMTLDDLAEYQTVSRKPVEIAYRDYRVLSCGSPASGAAILSALKTVEGYEDIGEAEKVNISTHRLDEALRFAYGERARLGDPDHSPGIREQELEMLSASSAIAKRKKISDEHTLDVHDYDPDGFEIKSSHGTSHIVAADSSGLAISLTTTINLIFGSHVMIPETGVIMNNQMNDFSVPGQRNAFGYIASPENFVYPRKRPLSSATPVIVEHLANNTLFYLIGAAGGSRIITSTVQNLWYTMDWNMSAIESLSQPRFHDQLLPNTIDFEWGFPQNATELGGVGKQAHSGIGTGFVEGYDNQTVAFMCSRQHNVSWVPPGYSSAQAIQLHVNGTWEAAAEPRQRNSGGFVV